MSKVKKGHLGALLLTASLVIVVGSLFFLSPGVAAAILQFLYFLLLIILLTSLLLPTRTMLLVIGLSLLIISATFFIPGITNRQAFSLLLYAATMSFLVIIGTISRNTYLTRLQISEERFRHLTHNAPDIIYVFNLTTQQIEYTNRDDFVGYSLTELVSTNTLIEHIYEGDREATQAFWRTITQHTAPHTQTIDYRVRHKNGEWEWVQNRITPLTLTPDGSVEKIKVVLTLITERKQTENLLQLVTAAAPNAMIVTNAEGNIIYANPQVSTMFGYRPQELIGQSVNRLIPPRFRTYHFDLYTHYFQNPSLRPMGHGRYLSGLRRNGQEFPIEIALNPIQTPTGALVLVSMTDITERQRAEQTIHQQAEYLRILVEQTPVGIITVNQAGDITDVNQRTLQILGLENQTVIQGSNIFTLPSLTNTAIVAMLERVLTTGQKEEREFWYSAETGKQSYLQVRAVPHFDGQGQQIGLIILAEDLTQRVQAEEGMRRMQKMESLGVLAGGIAHDFNNLLVAMLGQTSLALAKARSESLARPHIQKAITAAERASQLTQQLLAYSGRGQFQVVPLNLNTLIEENAHLFAATIPKHIHLRHKLLPALPPIQADIAQMQQVIMNLIINAAEAIGDTPGTITIVTEVQHLEPDSQKYWHYTLTPLVSGYYVTLELHDTGKGIATEILTKIFDPFFTTKPTGHGLGLAAVMGIVKGHHGGLTVYSEIGQGTTFKLLLPVSEGVAFAPEAELEDEMGMLSGLVLVIDDEATVREAVIDILGLEGVEVLAAADGEQGLALYQERQAEIFLVLLDLSMPGWNGERTLRELRHVNPDVRIILSSGYNELEATQRFAGKALTGFLQKPYSAEKLLSAVKQQLTLSN